MELSDLLQKRMKIAMNALNADPGVTESTRAAMSILAESLTLQKQSVTVVEGEVSGKVSAFEFEQAMAGKLSVKEFLGYFKKVERIVEKMENYWSGGETKTAAIAQQMIRQWGQQFEARVDNRLEGLESQFSMFEDRCLQCENAYSEIAGLSRRLSEVEHQTQQLHSHSMKGFEALEKTLRDEVEKINRGHSVSSGFPSEKMNVVAGEMRKLQSYFNEVHEEIKNVLNDIISPSRVSTQKSVTEEDNSSLIARIDDLGSKMHAWEQRETERWGWQCEAAGLRWRKKSGQNFKLQSMDITRSGVIIHRDGFYKVTVGYLGQQTASGCLRLCTGSNVVHTVELKSTSNVLCRTTMLYLWLSAGTTLALELLGNGGVTGFLELGLF